MSEEIAHGNLRRSRYLVDRLVQSGVAHFIICPGSRSTPLVYAAAERDDATTFVHFDERGAAYYALGYARAANRTAAVIATSGTAVPNLMPAVVEAANDRLPLILLTGDRPARLRGSGSNQTIDQRRIFGSFADYRELDDTDTLDGLSDSGGLSYPLQINCSFDEPLLPSPVEITPLTVGASGPNVREDSEPGPPDCEISRFRDFLHSAASGIIVVGMLRGPKEARAVAELAAKLNWPLLPDITSGLRLGVRGSNVFAHYDLVLSAGVGPVMQPLSVLHVGGRFVSKALLQWLQKTEISRYWLLGPFSEPFDPAGRGTDRIVGPVAPICQALTAEINPEGAGSAPGSWQDYNKKAGQLLSDNLSAVGELSGASVASRIVKLTPEDHGLFFASSLPIRWADWFAPANGPRLRVGANRGASGIDGAIASAAGFAVGLRAPVTLLVGDQALLHDLNSLAILSQIDFPVTVVILNNGGGGIFDHLPIREHRGIFEKYFVAAHDVRFDSAARQFDLPYLRPDSIAGFEEMFAAAARSGSPSVIEVVTDRRSDLRQHRQIIVAVKTGLERD